MQQLPTTVSTIDFEKTGYFSSIVTQYIKGAPALLPYFKHTSDFAGLAQAMAARKLFPTDRSTLVKALKQQYEIAFSAETTAPLSENSLHPVSAIGKQEDATNDPDAFVKNNIELLADSNTFTITTAHQPNLFTGYLYFAYKILHTVKLAAAAKAQFPENNFVPVYYMGSEDADLDELGKIFLDGDPIFWETRQTGAVGRMHTKELEPLLERLNGQLSVLPHGPELMRLLRECYLNAPNMQIATFKFVHQLFKRFGVIVLIPDQSAFKAQLIPVFKADLLTQKPSFIVNNTLQHLEAAGFKVQAKPRDINLFYLDDQIRERIVREGEHWTVLNSTISWTQDELLQTLENHPEKFSPNVILRGILQETILPNIAFIGGGGELAYWLELKDLFEHYSVPYPVLLLRNSFLFIPRQEAEKRRKWQLTLQDLFQDQHQLLTQKAIAAAANNLDITEEIETLAATYKALSEKTAAIDPTLLNHVAALQAHAENKLRALQKKIVRAETRKHADFNSVLTGIKTKLFPNNSLQERIDNVLPYYARYGAQFLDIIYDSSPAFAKAFVVIEAEREEGN